MFHYYTLRKLLANNIEKINNYLKNSIIASLEIFDSEVDLGHIVENSVEFIEKNSHLLKYGDMTLYEHQKEVFTAMDYRLEFAERASESSRSFIT